MFVDLTRVNIGQLEAIVPRMSRSRQGRVIIRAGNNRDGAKLERLTEDHLAITT